MERKLRKKWGNWEREKMPREWENWERNGEKMRKWRERENGERMRKWRENEEMEREWENGDSMARKRRHGEGVNLHFSPSLHFPILSLSPFSHSLSISFQFSRLLSICSPFSHSLAIFSEAASQLPSTCASLLESWPTFWRRIRGFQNSVAKKLIEVWSLYYVMMRMHGTCGGAEVDSI